MFLPFTPSIVSIIVSFAESLGVIRLIAVFNRAVSVLVFPEVSLKGKGAATDFGRFCSIALAMLQAAFNTIEHLVIFALAIPVGWYIIIKEMKKGYNPMIEQSNTPDGMPSLFSWLTLFNGWVEVKCCQAAI